MSSEASAAEAAAAGKQEYRGVQALRAIAALAVVAGHSTDYLALENGVVPSAFRYLHGSAGVDIFFVISGFVMAVSAQRLRTRPHPARLFLWRRLIRIVPLYWLLTLVKYLTTDVQPRLSVHGRPAFGELIFSLLFLPYRSYGASFYPLIAVGWTLSFEMMFYGLFAAALLVRRGYVRLLLPAIVAIAVAGQLRGPTWPVLLNPIVLEFLAGVGLGVLTMDRRLPPRWLAMLLPVAGVLVLIVAEPGASPMERPLLWGTGAAALVWGVVAMEPVWGRRVPGWLLLLGDASYSIYLVQSFVFPPLHGVLEIWAPRLVHARPVATGLLILVGGVVCAAALGVVVYRTVERPMTETLRRGVGAARPEPVVPS